MLRNLPSRGVTSEEHNRFGHCHAEDVVDVPSTIAHIKDCLFEPFSFAGVTGKIKVCKELHLHLDNAVTFTRFTSPPGTLKEKNPACSHGSADWVTDKIVPDLIEDPDVRNRI
jgi:hypothetical protein